MRELIQMINILASLFLTNHVEMEFQLRDKKTIAFGSGQRYKFVPIDKIEV